MKNYGCCWCGKSTDKGILDKEENKGCCCKNCTENYKKTDRYKEIESQDCQELNKHFGVTE